jgi:predicted PurR-regulated permease PerM
MKPSDGYRVVGLAAGLVVAGLLAAQLTTLLLGAAVAVILALPLAAAADQAQRRGLPRLLGASAALLVLTAIVVGLGLAIIPPFIEQVKEFSNRLPSILTSVQHQLGPIKGLHTGNLSHSITGVINGYINNPNQIIGPAAQVGSTVAVDAAGIILVLVGAFTMAVNPEPVLGFALRLAPMNKRALMRDVMGRVRKAWVGWMTAVALDMVVLGTLLWLGMVIVGLPFAIGFATFSALLTVIPNYGSIISAVPPILAALAESPTKAVLVLIVYVIVNQIEGNLLLPLIMARTVDMHPAVVAIGLLVVAALFGVIGVFIAIPLISLAMILVQALWIEPQEAAARAQLAIPPPSGVGSASGG